MSGMARFSVDDGDSRRRLHRVVQVVGTTAGSGFAVGPDLVLTATHLLGAERWAKVYVPARRQELRAVVLAAEGDIALLQVAVKGEPTWPEVEIRSVRFGRPDGDRPVRCLAPGFPSFQQRRAGRGLEAMPRSLS